MSRCCSSPRRAATSSACRRTRWHRHLADGAAIRVVGVPVDGVPSDAWVLRGAPCTAGPTSRLVELEWLWDAATSSDCGGILGGSSGSPVFGARRPDRASSASSTRRRSVPAPASRARSGSRARWPPDGTTTTPVDRTYAMPVGSWDDCFTPAWDPAAPGARSSRRRPRSTRRCGRSGRGRRGGRRSRPATAGPSSSRPDRWGRRTAVTRPATPWRPTPTFDEPLPLTEGVVVLCAAAVDDRGAARDDRRPGTAVMVVDGTPPGPADHAGPGQRGRRRPGRADLRPAGAVLVRPQGRRRHRLRRPRRLRHRPPHPRGRAGRRPARHALCGWRGRGWEQGSTTVVRAVLSRDAFRVGRVRVPR